MTTNQRRDNKTAGRRTSGLLSKTVTVSQTGTCQAESAWASPGALFKPSGLRAGAAKAGPAMPALLCPLSRFAIGPCVAGMRPVRRVTVTAASRSHLMLFQSEP